MPYIFLALVIILLVAVILARALRFRAPSVQVEPGLPIQIDVERAAQHLAAAIRIPTISFGENSPVEQDAFHALHRKLEEMYPRLHRSLEKIPVNDYSLVYRWAGSQPDLDPILLLAHQDVVPADPTTWGDWGQPPFSGAIHDGYIWGRGTLDCKNQLIGTLEAAETLLEKGFHPQRTVLFAFGHDEEIGGQNGAEKITCWMKDQDIRVEAVLDEGGAVLKGGFPGIEGLAAVIGTVEKGHIDVRLHVTATAGHASTPPRQTAVGILSKAITRIEANPMPAHLDQVLPMFRGLGENLPFTYRIIFANQWLFSGILRKILEDNPQMNASIRTSIAATIIHGGIKENILPREVYANLNIRLLPGDSIDDVLNHLRSVIRDDRVKITLTGNCRNEASPVSPTDVPAFEILKASIGRTYGDIPTTPYLMLGGSDARYYAAVSSHIYRFSPMVLTSEELDSVHGINERTRVDDFANNVRFFIDLILNWSAPFI
ncbi:MAG: M20 family peptidase [Anaerolineales bacterium]|nr:M20 family peptidase [Anaerolineales bacterium]